MFVITNENKDYLCNNGVWSVDKTEAMHFETQQSAQKLIDDISNIILAFTDLFPTVVPLT